MGPLVYAYIVVEGMLAFAAIHYFLLWWRSRSERVLLIFSLFSALVTLLVAVTVNLVTADSMESAQRALDWRTTLGVFAYPLLLWLISELTSVPVRRTGRGLIAALAMVAIANAVGARVNGTVTGLAHARL